MMATPNFEPHGPPIARLTHDVIWFIFSLNADMELPTEKEQPALLNLRHASQVCSTWRELVISSPSLWARVLNLHCLSLSSKKWWEEVLRRTGRTLLDINACHQRSWAWLDVADWLLIGPTAQWARVRSLKIAISYPRLPLERNPLWSQLFGQPAPHLEDFEFWYFNLLPTLTAPDFILFANTAPLLHTLRYGHPVLNLATLSLNNLRCLILNPFSMTAPDLLRGLAGTPVLERLDIVIAKDLHLPPKQGTETLQQVNLPRLANIWSSMENGVDLALTILAHITPSTNCVLLLIAECFEGPPSAGIPELYSKVLSRYLGYCTKLATATNLKIVLSDDEFFMEVGPSLHPYFYFNLVDRVNKFPEHIISSLLSSVSTILYATITTLHLLLKDIPQASKFDATSMVQSLSSVDELVTDFLTLVLLNEIQATSPITIMPKIRIIRCLFRLGDGEYESTALADFFDSRIKLNISTEGITVRFPYSEQAGDYFELLHRFEGLRMQTYSHVDTFQDYVLT